MTQQKKPYVFTAADRLAIFLHTTFPDMSETARSKELGFPNTTVREWLKGRRIPPKALVRLEELGCDMAWLLAGDAVKQNAEVRIQTRILEHEWPVRGLAAADDSGGRLAPMEDDFGNPVTPPPGLLLVPVRGDSMSPVVLPGQYVAIDQDREGFEVDGGIVVAYIEEPSAEDERREPMTGTFVKRCYKGDGILYFTSVNDYPPFSAWEDHCRIWPVIGVWFADRGKPPAEG